MKKVLSILLCILMFVSVCPVAVLAADGGDGSTEDLPSSAIAISNVDELVMICNEYPADGYYYLTGDIDLSYALGEYGDYYNGGKGWEPIGNSTTPFMGTFDGRGYTIKGLSINRPSQDYIGLFGYASRVTIKNCKLDMVSIVGANYVGGVAGYSINSTFEDCETLGGTVSSSTGGKSIVGGIIGHGTGTIKNCKNNGTVSSRSYGEYGSYSGGIIGYGTETISNCTNNGDVSSFSANNSASSGGIIGCGDTEVNNCTNNGNISSSIIRNLWSSYYPSAGGIIGRRMGSAEARNCTNNGDVSANDYAGGIIGHGGGNAYNCTNSGKVTGSDSSGIVAGGSSMCSYIEKCINFGEATYAISDDYESIENCYNFSLSTFGDGYRTKNCYSISSLTAESGTVWLSDGSQVTFTNEQMRLQSTFEGFDFENTWTMEGNPDFPYPELISNPSSYKKTPESISVVALPDKVNYLEGKDELDLTGGIITVYYDDSTSTMPMTPDMITGFDNSKPGTQTLTVTYLGKTATFDVVIKAKSLVGFELVKNPVKTVYKEGEALTLEGIVGRFTYDNGAIVDLPISTESVSGFDNRKVGKQTITVTIDTYVDSFEVTVEHDYRETVVPPTCIKKGYTEYTCAECGDSYVDEFTAATDEHDFTNGIVIKTPSCTEAGSITVSCKNCGLSVSVEVPAKGHTVNEWTVDGNKTSGTCTECGETVIRTETDDDVKVCERCGYYHTESTGLFKYKGVFCSIAYFFRQIMKFFMGNK